MTQAATRQSTYSEIISCPIFRAGYDAVWHSKPPHIDRGWGDDEQLSYERGRRFAIYVLTEERLRVPLSKGAIPHPRAVVLLMMAFCSGDVL